MRKGGGSTVAGVVAATLFAVVHHGGGEMVRELSLEAYVAEVMASNVGLAGQGFSLEGARAGLVSARTSPNPTLRFTYGSDITHERQPTIYGAGVSQVIETAGKRRLRVEVAKRELGAATAAFQVIKAELRERASLAYLEAAHRRGVVLRKREWLQRLEGGLLEKPGTKGEGVAEAIAELREQLELDVEEATISQMALGEYLHAGVEGRYIPTSTVASLVEVREGLLQQLEGALLQRPDLKAAREQLGAATWRQKLARAQRYPDFELSAGIQQATRTVNPIDPTPNFNSASFGIAFPLPFFNSMRGELEAASSMKAQAAKALVAIEGQARHEARQAVALYRLARKRATLLQRKTKLLEQRRGYRGHEDLVGNEKAIAEQYLAFDEALFEQAKAALTLRRIYGFPE